MIHVHGKDNIMDNNQTDPPVIQDSILNTIKGMLNIDLSETVFDSDLIAEINSVFLILNQLGVGPDTPYLITSASETWANFWGTKTSNEMVKTYVFLKVRMIFDTPEGVANDAYANLIAEYEDRLKYEVEYAAAMERMNQ